MDKKTNRPRYFVAWRHNEENHWEAVSKEKFSPFIDKLLRNGINPASIFMSMGSMVHWVFPEYHNGANELWIKNLYKEINGTSNPSDCSSPGTGGLINE